MMKIKKLISRITPHYVTYLDKKIIVNNPLIWSTKLHYVIFYAATISCVTGLYGFFFPVNAITVHDPSWYFFGGGLITVVLVVFWIRSTLKFDIGKMYGKRGRFYDLKYCLVCTIGLILIIGTWLVPAYVINYRTMDYVNGNNVSEQIEKEVLNKLTWYKRSDGLEPYPLEIKFVSMTQYKYQYNANTGSKTNVFKMFLKRKRERNKDVNKLDNLDKKIHDANTNKNYTVYQSRGKYRRIYYFQNDSDILVLDSYDFLNMLRIERLMNDYLGSKNESMTSMADKFDDDYDAQENFINLVGTVNSHYSMYKDLNDIPYFHLFSIMMVLIFYLIVLRSAVDLFGFKHFARSTVLFCVCLGVVSFIVALLSITVSSISPHTKNEFLFLAVILESAVFVACVWGIFYLKNITRYMKKAYFIWLFIYYVLPVLVIMGIVIGGKAFKLDDNDTLFLVYIMGALMTFIFFPWHRYIIYKLYSLPK